MPVEQRDLSALYDKMYRRDVLEWACARCRANGGAPGIDDQTFEDIEAYGLDRWLDELADDLKKRTYSRATPRLYTDQKTGIRRFRVRPQQLRFDFRRDVLIGSR